ncbi:DNA replication complex GINS protein Psf3 [Oratosquilla oratoria]|uniref:DNA replication complex GINS protein Psf3 n=1 Tax=Oratosquilla oratoria TaxID=337810 RepID=UPI003F75D1D9
MEISSYFPNYFSIEDILASQERVPCKYEVTVYGLGSLDPSNASPNLEAGSRMELPCWLARELCSSRRHIVSAQLPTSYKEKYREILRADANVVDLHKLGPHFYEFGRHLLPLSGPEGADLHGLLIDTLRHRFRKVMDASQNAMVEDVGGLTSKLDEMEKGLFKAGQKSFYDHQQWLRRQTHILRTSAMVEQHNKRKFTEIS